MNDQLSDAEVAWHIENPPDVMGNSKQLQRLAREVLEWRRVYPQRITADHPFERQPGSNMCVCGEPDTSHSPTLRLIENYAPSPVRFQAVCARCGWHWPQRGYVTQETARSVYGQHDCGMHTHGGTWSAAPESLLNSRRRKDLERIHRPAVDAEGTCTICGVPDVHCQCPAVVDAAPSYSETAAVMDQTVVDE